MTLLRLLLVVVLAGSVAAATITWARPTARSRAGAAVVLALVTCVAIIIVTVADLTDGSTWITAFDLRDARWASVHISGFGTDIVTIVTYLGATVTVIVLAAATALYAWRRTRIWQIPAFLLAVTLGQTLLNNAIKFTVERPRPDIDPAVQLETWSFPSGHSTAAAATYLALAVVLGCYVSERARAVLIVSAVGIATAIAMSRVLLGVHWFSDAVVGLMLGWSWFALCFVAFRYLPHLEWQQATLTRGSPSVDASAAPQS